MTIEGSAGGPPPIVRSVALSVNVAQGTPPADIMRGSLESLVERSVQLLRRVKAEPEYTLVGGILRFESMVKMVQDELKCAVNVPAGDLAQYVAALGAAVLGHQRLRAPVALHAAAVN